jgi:hypothetical protein
MAVLPEELDPLTGVDTDDLVPAVDPLESVDVAEITPTVIPDNLNPVNCNLALEFLNLRNVKKALRSLRIGYSATVGQIVSAVAVVNNKISQALNNPLGFVEDLIGLDVDDLAAVQAFKEKYGDFVDNIDDIIGNIENLNICSVFPSSQVPDKAPEAIEPVGETTKPDATDALEEYSSDIAEQFNITAGDAQIGFNGWGNRVREFFADIGYGVPEVEAHLTEQRKFDDFKHKNYGPYEAYINDLIWKRTPNITPAVQSVIDELERHHKASALFTIPRDATNRMITLITGVMEKDAIAYREGGTKAAESLSEAVITFEKWTTDNVIASGKLLKPSQDNVKMTPELREQIVKKMRNIYNKVESSVWEVTVRDLYADYVLGSGKYK